MIGWHAFLQRHIAEHSSQRFWYRSVVSIVLHFNVGRGSGRYLVEIESSKSRPVRVKSEECTIRTGENEHWFKVQRGTVTSNHKLDLPPFFLPIITRETRSRKAFDLAPLLSSGTSPAGAGGCQGRA